MSRRNPNQERALVPFRQPRFPWSAPVRRGPPPPRIVYVNPPPPPRQQGQKKKKKAAPARQLRNPFPKFKFTVDDLVGNSNGILKFGPSLSQYPTFIGGILKSFHDYRIESVEIHYVSNAASTTAGAMALEVDSSCSKSSLSTRVISSPLSKSFTRVFSGPAIRGNIWHSTLNDQFWLLYKANGKSNDIAGQFVITLNVHWLNPQ
ncbi:coat protein [Almond luteovirus 1]|nr:coat protein [Almond luteovirus 1]